MGICWGSPDFPTPSFVSSFRDLKVSSSEDTTSAFKSSGESETNQDSAGAAPEVWSSSSSEKPRVFKLVELVDATGDFRFLLGESRLDVKHRVYRGWLREGRGDTQIAVKLVEFKKRPSPFRRSIILRKIKHLYSFQSHPNLAQLLGYCLTKEKLLLVHEHLEFCSTLEDELFKGSSVVIEDMDKNAALAHLPWGRRVQIATETARGLAHLHNIDLMVLQYFQASCVLLDKSHRVKIAAHSFLESDLSSIIRGTGTKYGGTGDKKEAENPRKQDIYDFGVVLIEILTGLALGRNQGIRDYSLLVDWIKQRISKRDSLAVLMDSCIGNYSHDAALEVAQLALLCLDPDPQKRPPMYQVKETLEGIKVRQDFCECQAAVMSRVHSLDGRGTDDFSSLFELRNSN